MTEIYRDGKRVVSQFDDPTTITRRDRFAMAALTGLFARGLIERDDKWACIRYGSRAE